MIEMEQKQRQKQKKKKKQKQKQSQRQQQKQIYLAGDELYRQGKFAQALGQYYSKPMSSPLTLLRIGNCHDKMGNFEQAIFNFDKALKLSKTDCKLILFNKGNSLRRIGRLQQADKCYESALQQDPQYLDALLNQAKLKRKIGRTDQADYLYKKLLNLAPNDSKVLFNKAIFQRSIGDRKKALQLLNKALFVEPNNKQLYVAKLKLIEEMDPSSSEIPLLKEMIGL